ncbi:MAG: GNAT family N-acetyltransferase [Ignavibacteria bacterium]|jgi:lipid II:glycine glycyltransferase (peptidoglycan interpeptide bridge formation enzyme)
MSNKIRIVSEDEFEKVDDFLSKNFSSPTHWKEWNLAISKQFDTEFFYYAYFDNGNLTGICPVHKIKNKYNFRLVSGPKEYFIPYGGWIFSKTTNFDSKMLNLKINENLEIYSLPLLNEFNASYKGYKTFKFYKTSLINLGSDEDEIWNSFPSKRRNKIRKALKYNTEILSIDDIGIDSFYEFYVLTNKQYGLLNLSKDFFLELLGNARNIHIDILFAVYNSEILGSVVLVSDKNYSIYWLGARLEEAPNIGYFDLLQWETIKKAKARGCKFYDLCYLEKDRLPKIYKFKSDYSKNQFDILNVNYKSIAYRLINKIQKIF